MPILDLDTIHIDYTWADGPTCVRLSSDPEHYSSLHPTIEAVLLESPEILELVEAADEEPTELNFDED